MAVVPPVKEAETNFILFCFQSALENGPFSWQSTQFYSEKVQGYNSYYQFCDYIEVHSPHLLLSYDIGIKGDCAN